MKRIVLFMALCAGWFSLINGQTTDTSTTFDSQTFTSDTVIHEIRGDKPSVSKDGDTTRIRLGKKGIIIIEKNGKTTVHIDSDKNLEEDKTENVEDYQTEVPDKDEKPWKKHKTRHFEPHYGGVELFLNNYVNAKHSLTLTDQDKFMDLNTSKSIGVNVNFEYGIPLTNWMGFVTGIGICFNSYYFNNQNNMTKDSSGIIVIKPLPSDVGSYDKTKFRDTYINVPILYEIQLPTGRKRPLYFSAGVICGVKISSTTKEIYHQNGKEITSVVESDLNLAPFRYGLQARAGFGIINLFATYYPTQLFEKNKGPELYPIEVGLTLLSF